MRPPARHAAPLMALAATLVLALGGLLAAAACCPVAAAPPPAASAAQPPTLHVTVGDLDVGYRVLGQGPPLLLVMGFRGTMDTWDPTLLRELAAHYLVILFDNRGAGATTAPPTSFSITQLADDTAGLLDALGIARAHVLGYSMGGYIAQELALRQPARVDRLILHSTMCGGAESAPVVPESLAVLADTTPGASGERILEALLPAPWIAQNRAYLNNFAALQHEHVPAATVERQYQAMADWPGACPRLAAVTSPAIVVAGTADAVIPPANALVLANHLPEAWLAWLANGGHAVQYQYPRQLAATIHNFLTAP